MVEQGGAADADRGEASREGTQGGVDAAPLGEGELRTLVEFLARNLVTKPDQVSVTAARNGDSLVFELRVDKEDLGRVIGKQGRTAKSLRTILNAAASRASTKAALEIVEE